MLLGYRFLVGITKQIVDNIYTLYNIVSMNIDYSQFREGIYNLIFAYTVNKIQHI